MNINDILAKAAQGERLTPAEGLILYQDGDPEATTAEVFRATLRAAEMTAEIYRATIALRAEARDRDRSRVEVQAAAPAGLRLPRAAAPLRAVALRARAPRAERLPVATPEVAEPLLRAEMTAA